MGCRSGIAKMELRLISVYVDAEGKSLSPTHYPKRKFQCFRFDSDIMVCVYLIEFCEAAHKRRAREYIEIEIKMRKQLKRWRLLVLDLQCNEYGKK